MYAGLSYNVNQFSPVLLFFQQQKIVAHLTFQAMEVLLVIWLHIHTKCNFCVTKALSGKDRK